MTRSGSSDRVSLGGEMGSLVDGVACGEGGEDVWWTR